MSATEIFVDYINEARLNIEQHKLEKAEEMLALAKQLKTQISDNNILFNYYVICSDLLVRTNRRDLCPHLWEEALEYCDDPTKRSVCAASKGMILLRMHRYDEALVSANVALKEAADLEPIFREAPLRIIGDVYQKEEKWDEAISVFSELAAVSEITNDQMNIAFANARIAQILNKKGFPNLAIDRLFEAEQHAREYGQLELIQKIAIWRADIYAETGQQNKALDLLHTIAQFDV